MAEKIRYPEIGVMMGIAGSEARREAASADERLIQTRDEIRRIFSVHDPVKTLSGLAMYAIVENEKSGRKHYPMGIETHELEVLQALALSVEPGTEIASEKISAAVGDLIDLGRANTSAFQQKALLRLTDDDVQNRRLAILERIRATTQTVRGTRHPFQTRDYLKDVSARMDIQFKEHLGFSPVEFSDFFQSMTLKAADRMESVRQRARRWLRAERADLRLRYFGEDNPGLLSHPLVRSITDPAGQEVKARLWMATESLFEMVFRIDEPSEDDSDSAKALFRTLMGRSMQFGDISPERLDYVYLDNPVALAPFVLSPSGQPYLFCISSAILAQVDLLEEIIGASQKLQDTYQDFKARWLENKLYCVVTKAFPSAKTFINAKWVDLAGEPGETDCILTVDKTVGLFEAKSGRITPPARRGAQDRLARQINELMVKPSRQSARFARLLQSTPRPIPIHIPGDTAEIGGSETREIIRLNVLFDTLGPLSACSRLLIRAGYIDSSEHMAPTMSIFELENVFDLLPDQTSRIHYLRRRIEIEQTSIFDADEMDMLALYIDNCFCLRPLPPEAEGFSVYGWSENLSQIYDIDGSRAHTSKLKRIPLWDEMIRANEKRQDPGWTRFGYLLSSVPYRDQWGLFRIQEKLRKKARKLRPGQCAFSGAFAPGGAFTIILCVGNNVSEHGIYRHAEEAAESLMAQSEGDEALLVYWDITFRDAPFTFIATVKRRRPAKR